MVEPAFDVSRCSPGAPATIYVAALAELDWCNLDFGAYGLAFDGGHARTQEPDQRADEAMIAQLVAVSFGDFDEVEGQEAAAIVRIEVGAQLRWELHVFTLAAGAAVSIATAPVPRSDEVVLSIRPGQIEHAAVDAAGRACAFVLVRQVSGQLAAGDYGCSAARPKPRSTSTP